MGQVVWDEFMWWEDTDKDNSLLCRVGVECFSEVGKSFLVSRLLLFGLYVLVSLHLPERIFFLDVLLKSQEDYLHAQEPPFPRPCMHFVVLKYNRTSRLMCGRGLLRWRDADHSDVLPYSS